MSETGIILPDGDYVQDTNPNGVEYAEDGSFVRYPEGSFVVPLRPSQHHDWINDQWVYVAPPVTTFDVNEERNRRLASPLEFQGNEFDFDDISKIRITGAATLAMGAVLQGAQPGDYLWHGGTDPFSWITEDNQIVQLDAHQMFALGNAAASREALIIMRAKSLKTLDPIPQDYEQDSYWQ